MAVSVPRLFLTSLLDADLVLALALSAVSTAALARLSVLGVLVLGGLSGFGSITTALNFFGRMSRSHW